MPINEPVVRIYWCASRNLTRYRLSSNHWLSFNKTLSIGLLIAISLYWFGSPSSFLFGCFASFLIISHYHWYATSTNHPCRFFFSLLLKTDQEVIIRWSNILKRSWACCIYSVWITVLVVLFLFWKIIIWPSTSSSWGLKPELYTQTLLILWRRE